MSRRRQNVGVSTGLSPELEMRLRNLATESSIWSAVSVQTLEA